MGTIVNSAAVILGGLIGLTIRRGLPRKVEETAIKLLGLAVFIIGIEGVITSMITVGEGGKLSSSGSITLIASLVLEGVLANWATLTQSLPQAAGASKYGSAKRGSQRVLPTLL